MYYYYISSWSFKNIVILAYSTETHPLGRIRQQVQFEQESDRVRENNNIDTHGLLSLIVLVDQMQWFG